MKELKENSYNHPQKESVLSIGADLGGKLGFLLSIFYSLAGLLFELLIKNVTGDSITSLFLMNILIVFFLVSLPSTILGIITGLVIGLLSKLLSNRLSIKNFIILSSIVCTAIIIALHWLIFDFSTFWRTAIMQESYFEFGMRIIDKYYYLFGLPSLIYIVSGGWVGKRLYSK